MSFSDDIIEKVWKKGTVTPSNPETKWRKDACGAWMSRKEHGNRDSEYGWEVDHIKPKGKGGPDDLSNLRPLQWKNNAEKNDDKLTCPVTSSAEKNVKGS